MRTLFLLSTLALTCVVHLASAQDLGEICSGARGPQQAIQACDRLLQTQTSPMSFTRRANLFYNRGLARAYLGDEDGAIADFTRAIQDNPNFADAYNNRGFALAKQGKLDDAQLDLEKALDINPNLTEARETLAKIIGSRPPPSGARLIDEWETRSGSLGHRYRFQPDGTYEYAILQVIAGSPRTVEVKRGTYMVQGDRLTLTEQGRASTIYRWSIVRDPVNRDSRTPVLSLSGPQGTQQFYGSAR
jgi:tetratricopeptide (TPR) repeat protein